MKKSLLLAVILCVTSLVHAQGDQVIFSSSGGIYEASFQLSLRCVYPNHHIRYTTNGCLPTASSTLYEAPMMLDERLYSTSDIYTIQISPDDLVFIPDSVRHAIVIRAAVFDENENCISPTATNTYWIQSLGFVDNGYAVVSLCADTLALFDYETGIFVPGVNFNPEDPVHTGNYYQKGREWERLANVEFYEPTDNSGMNQACGLRAHGNLSRRHPAKGMKIYAREEYGKKRFQHDFFQDPTVTSFKHLLFKPFAIFEPYSGVQDPFCTALARQLNVEAPQCRPVLLYLNGEYWGIYFLQEKMDERFLEDHLEVNPDQCNIIGAWWDVVECGSDTSFLRMMHWFETSDLSDEATYEQACDLIDIDNFIDYYVLETFIGNWDWPGNNMRCWQEGNGRWRWIFFDGDATLMGGIDPFENAAVYTPPHTWINYPEAKLLFGKLLHNATFKEAFRNRAEALCESLFLYENTYPIFYNLVETLRPRINDQRHRFGYPPTDALWEHGNSVIQDFLQNRVHHYLTMMDASDLTSLDEIPLVTNPITCYPNPVTGAEFFILTYSESERPALLEMYDVTGRQVHQRDITFHQGVNILSMQTDLPSGLYIVKIGNHGTRIVIE